jgi:hypothetical protein
VVQAYLVQGLVRIRSSTFIFMLYFIIVKFNLSIFGDFVKFSFSTFSDSLGYGYFSGTSIEDFGTEVLVSPYTFS